MAQHTMVRRNLLRLLHCRAAYPAGEYVALTGLGHFADGLGDIRACRKRRWRADREHRVRVVVRQHFRECPGPLGGG